MASNGKQLLNATVLLSQILIQPQGTLLGLSLGKKGDQSLCDYPEYCLNNQYWCQSNGSEDST
ncbi:MULTISPECIES: hypothetical protein [unclassified Moorena]|uniref:hypothetical protein n=1 Tax=unclassified Moorena TaxID=2683338 RepID=UPI0010560DD4|nr:MULTISPECIES: hypothetical protein [unclassified Moorena]NEQ07712.1 hypothetical protein [Moorena sp. SIO4E2]NEP32163.1 hypothetical protein [Moorena sp. SIO3B2]NEP67275.1 hypothetical protein [Moorena sp. SIO3A5]NER86544.1 hypothetical protein [Moorena sp. SIO3A2]NET65710.1 hypothetical protein [Moorena sp. SIO1G6]